MFGMMGSAIITTQYIQSVLGYSALEAALWSLLPSLVVGGAAPAAAVLAARVGRPPVMGGAFAVAALGFIGMRFDECPQPLARIGKQHVLDEGDGTGGALDVGEDRFDAFAHAVAPARMPSAYCE